MTAPNRNLQVCAKAFLTDEIEEDQPIVEQIATMEHFDLPTKRKDLGRHNIIIHIGNKGIDKALLDLGAGVNVLPYDIYEELGLEELKPTRMTLEMTYR